MIRFEQVSKRYPGGKQALSGVNFDIPRGSMVFLTGHSGAGKSTLLRLVMMLERASRGQVLVGGRNLSKLPDKAAPSVRQQIGMIFQDHKLLNDKTVGDNVALPLMIAGLRVSDIRKRVRAALDKVGLLDRAKSWPLALSGGEQQRVGIARAIVSMPPLLLADEPTGNLDPDLSAELFGLFRSVSEAGVTVLIASHDLSLIRQMGQRVLVLSEGRLVDDIPAQSVRRLS
ncbi:MAG: cell division ATP-binding protein FtsE [Xanthomonadales bacterium]|nr:cell division ATP-binding protein FtsE [Xanthomonadales bacterium]